MTAIDLSLVPQCDRHKLGMTFAAAVQRFYSSDDKNWKEYQQWKNQQNTENNTEVKSNV